ncbi:DUF1868 domain-containing protein [Nodularia spumigena]|uniref:DUF1868 domain-containing protein n=2 Tax=Cyanophyceae TaxID=3028117 RepID=UPI00233053CA|nr:DUF1868 domain-containing protein [Nodularia spumigena]MDB9358128.1 DUF1868 domain-containing protein [Nodularia spumigena CS-587/03]MDB9398863.1 DUF1868 domain-containing protein [Microcystis aeruginosa CS-567/02-A1]MDB9306883.1 DUF1868 domain-containing protein [Nodularia spumigena CS-591/12]MDB9317214.1 DUF1868 domain-containing protein [Nodularia spumigena CS-590/01A]MDB9322373.1 DUF1868 domain-containing protein [Nodularia spumigena CS-591/07A]
MDDNYQTYLNRVARMTLPEAYRSQIQHIQESAKFRLHSGSRQAAPFPGYSLITPPAQAEAKNSTFYTKLQSYQQELLQLPVDSDLIVSVPPVSFHLTLADLIWDSAYLHACEKDPEFDQQLRSCCAEILQQYQESMTNATNPIQWQMLGLIVMPRSVGVCLVPQDERSYEQIIQFRRTIYQNPQLMALGIEQHYDFTAHVTLGYFGKVSPGLDRTNFSTMLSELNQQWLLNSPEFLIHRVELRKFDDMTHYYREPDWPSLNF